MEADILEELYREHYGAALLYSMALCGDTQLAQDLTEEAFVKAYLSLPDRIPSFRWWLLRVCKNAWIDHLRRQTRELGSDPLDRIASPGTPESIYIKKERSRALWNALEQLPPQDRELIALHYFSGLTLREASQLLGLPYTAARQRMVRLRQALKRHMEEQGYGL